MDMLDNNTSSIKGEFVSKLYRRRLWPYMHLKVKTTQETPKLTVADKTVGSRVRFAQKNFEILIKIKKLDIKKSIRYEKLQ